MAAMAHRVKLVVAYLGTQFHGWQRQSVQRTVQGELERAFRKLIGNPATVVGAGRTDTGVHAAAQVAHVDLPALVPPEGLVRGLNSILDPAIQVRSAHMASSGFHACKSARGKLYTYRARWGTAPLPWTGLRSARVRKVEDQSRLAAAAQLLIGRHDWASFTVPDPECESSVRDIFGVRLRPRRQGIDLEFVGNGFLRYQVRRMVGVLLEIGRGRRAMEDLRTLIDDPQPGAPIQTAPASGLTLERVYYRRSPLW
jgi:tRNA pseudouridine38-40 synthase